MRELISVVFLFMVCGCSVVTVNQRAITNAPAPASGERHAFASAETIKKLMLGISREEALALIGRTVTTGFELKGANEYKPVTVANPYRSQKITKGSDVFAVDYYLTEVRKADGVVTDDELTPLVFQADKLIGKGWEFFNAKIKQ